MTRTFTDRGGNVWTVREVDGRFGYDVAGLPTVWIDAPRPIDELSDSELVELVRSELETEGRAMPERPLTFDDDRFAGTPTDLVCEQDGCDGLYEMKRIPAAFGRLMMLRLKCPKCGHKVDKKASGNY